MLLYTDVLLRSQNKDGIISKEFNIKSAESSHKNYQLVLL